MENNSCSVKRKYTVEIINEEESKVLSEPYKEELENLNKNFMLNAFGRVLNCAYDHLSYIMIGSSDWDDAPRGVKEALWGTKLLNENKEVEIHSLEDEEIYVVTKESITKAIGNYIEYMHSDNSVLQLGLDDFDKIYQYLIYGKEFN